MAYSILGFILETASSIQLPLRILGDLRALHATERLRAVRRSATVLGTRKQWSFVFTGY